MTELKPCPTCGGRGVIHWHPHWDRGHMPCPACGDKSTAPLTNDKQENMMTDEITKEEFIERFVAELVRLGGEVFNDGSSIAEYGREVAPSYWDEDYQREEGPEACAEADRDCWEYSA